MNIDITAFSRCKILVVGDLMMDEYLWGDVDRISPEAPVQVVSVTREELILGGSGNVVNNLAALGARVAAVGVVGTGPDGSLMLEKFKSLDVDTSGIVREPTRPTTRKTRIIAAHQQVLRIDRETRRDISKDNQDSLIRAIAGQVPTADVVLISDYGKGVVTRDLVAQTTRSARRHGKPVIVDPKGLDFSKYAGASLITPNQKEAGLAAGVEITDNAALARAARRILDTVETDSLLITCGKDGMVLFERDGEPYRIRSRARQVFDVSGAGDTVVSTLGLAAAAGLTFREGAALANAAAGVVVGKVGTATLSPRELTAAIGQAPDGLPAKYTAVTDLAGIADTIRKKGRKIVLTNGCFDLLHAGHIKLFEDSRKLGDVLIVAIDDDDAVRALKGEGRPVINADQRIRILCALDSVDHVVTYSAGQLDRIIEIIRPDVLTKGSNYLFEEVTGHERVEQFGGRVVLVPLDGRTSSSRIIDTIKNNGSSPKAP